MKVDIEGKLIRHIEKCLFKNSFLEEKYFKTIYTPEEILIQAGVFDDENYQKKFLKIIPHYYLEGTYRNDEYRDVLRSQYLYDSYWSSAFGMYFPEDDKIIIDLNAIAYRTETLKNEKKVKGVSIDRLKRIVLIEQIAHRITRFGREECNVGGGNHFESDWIKNPYYQRLVAKIITYHCLDNDDRCLMEKYLPIDIYEVFDGQGQTKQGSRLADEEGNYMDNIYQPYLNDVNKLFQLILTIENSHLKKVNSFKKMEDVIKNIKLDSKKNILDKIY